MRPSRARIPATPPFTTATCVAGAGDPDHVKCLHAQLAFALADDDAPMLEWIGARADLVFPARCCLGDVRAESS